MDTNTLTAQAEIGEEAKRFLASDLGRIVIGLAEQELDAALDDMEKCDMSDTAKMMDIQLRIRLARRFPHWLNELLADGEEALAAWASQRKEQ